MLEEAVKEAENYVSLANHLVEVEAQFELERKEGMMQKYTDS